MLEYLFLATKFPDILTSWDKYDRVFTDNTYVILIIELVLILLMNLFCIIDGILASKYRINFINLELHAAVE